MKQPENKAVEGFSCIAFKRRAALELHSRLQGLDDAAVAKYWKNRNAAFIREQRRFTTPDRNK